MSSEDDEGAPWSAADSDPPAHRCGFELLPGDLDSGEGYDDLDEWRTDTASASCCREVWEDGRCRWHAGAEPEVLREAVAERDEPVQNLDGVVLRDVELEDSVSFAGCRLRGATFENVTAREADFADCNLSFAQFPDANLWDAQFPDADLRRAQFPDADLSFAQFPDADLPGAQFPDADLRGTTLSNADLRLADFSNVSVNRATTISDVSEPAPPSPLDGIRSRLPAITDSTAEKEEDDTTDDEDDDPLDWDQVARVYHDLKLTFDENGFVGRARRFHIQERRARRHETAIEEGWFSRRHLTALVSGTFTGYGVGVRRLLVTMAVLFAVSTLTYAVTPVQNPLLYSVITFTTAPPGKTAMLPVWAQVVAGVETFFGTLLIVSLGFVLGNREQF